VSRVVEVDTKGGPRFGLQQYKENDFLKEGEIVLTFDDGPLRRNTQLVLDALDAHCTKATFFMVGEMAASDPAMAREVARRGHTIGTHTWSHKNLKVMGAGKAETEMELGLSAVRAAIGQPIAPFFRFPYLSDSKTMEAHLQQRNIAMFSIDADSIDYRTRDPNSVHRRIVNELTANKKGIVLFHDIQPSTANALKGLLDDLKKRGFKVVQLVPKSSAQTLPTYDAMAANELARRHTAEVANPMAKRAIVYPIAGGTPLPVAQPAQSQVAAPTAPVTPAPVAVSPPPAAKGEPGWQDRIMRQ
jgi:peptidoglycan/xylan/chitin deacetylase (PgdA/CDA1 family)